MAESTSLTQFCGIGVVSNGETPYGLQIRLLDTPQETPAKKAGLQDGDILFQYRTRDGFRPVGFNEFMNGIPGMEGSPLDLTILRGVPLYVPSMSEMRSAFEKPNYPPLESLQVLRVNLRRERIILGLEKDMAVGEDAEIPYRSEWDRDRCTPVAYDGEVPATFDYAQTLPAQLQVMGSTHRS